MLKKLLPIVLLSSSAFASESFNTFVSGNVIEQDNSELYSFNFQHYFAAQTTDSVYDEFGYFDSDSNISAAYYSLEQGRATTTSQHIKGEYFHGNVLIGAQFQRFEFEFYSYKNSTSTTDLTLGYLFNDNLLVKATYNEDAESAILDASYSHSLNSQGDYIGFSITALDDLNIRTISSSYFGRLNNSNYIRLGFTHNRSDEFDDTTNYFASYYLSEATSVSFNSDFDLSYGLSAKHYFNTNTAIYLSYVYFDNDFIDDSISLSLIGQF